MHYRIVISQNITQRMFRCEIDKMISQLVIHLNYRICLKKVLSGFSQMPDIDYLFRGFRKQVHISSNLHICTNTAKLQYPNMKDALLTAFLKCKCCHAGICRGNKVLRALIFYRILKICESDYNGMNQFGPSSNLV